MRKKSTENLKIYQENFKDKEFWNSTKLMKLNISESIEENMKFKIIWDHLNLRRQWSWIEMKMEKKNNKIRYLKQYIKEDNGNGESIWGLEKWQKRARETMKED